MLAVLVVLGGSLSALAGNLPVRAQIYATAEQGGSQTYKTLAIYPLGDALFALNPTEDLQMCTYLRLYFVVDSDSISSFHIHLSRRTSVLQDASAGLNSFAIALYKWNNGSLTQYQSIVSEVQTERVVGESTVDYDWLFTTSTPYAGRNCISVTIPFSSFLWNHSTRFLFALDTFSFNGEEVGLTPLENDVSEINGAINEDVPLPSAVPSLEEIGGEIVNEGLNLAHSWMQYFTTNFDIAGAMGRVVKPFSDFFLEMPSDGNTAHTTLVVISLFSLGGVIVVWLINKLKRRQDDA